MTAGEGDKTDEGERAGDGGGGEIRVTSHLRHIAFAAPSAVWYPCSVGQTGGDA